MSHAPGIVLVPHTHWDREWYEPFQVFRYRLVEALDAVLDMAEADADFRFTLDGQTAAIEDYLEIRPDHSERVRRAVERGQLALGPWQILLDEFLCTGETIVRNLQMGWRGAQRLGGAMRVGYLPDMFGHIAQMPQILRRAGIQDAAFWRGAPGRVEGHAFLWEAPDGSAVRAEYLFDGYGNALDILLVPDRIGAALEEYHAATADRWGDDPVLGMVGTDHMAPDQRLMSWVRRNSRDEFPIAVATLGEYVERMPRTEALTRVVGELRSHARGNILPGVISIRRGLKIAMAQAERTVLEAERLVANHSDDDHAPYLEMAWRRIIESTAHDSVVGSGTDETVDQVAARLAEAGQIGRAVRDGVLRELARDVAADALLVANAEPRPRIVQIEVEVPAEDADMALVARDAEGAALPFQELAHTPTVLADERFAAADVERVLRRIHRRELFGLDIDRYELEPGRLTFHLAEVPRSASFDLIALRTELAAAARSHPGEWRVLTLAQPRRRAIVAVPVPASGLAALRVGQEGGATPPAGHVLAADRTLRNSSLAVTVEPDGTLTITGEDGTRLQGVGRLVDEGDRGDSYNFGPVAHGAVVGEPVAVRVTIEESGPLRGRIRIERDYVVPARLGEDPDSRSDATVPLAVAMTVELREGEPFVRVSLSFVNTAADHRLRFVIPLPAPADASFAEGQFGVTRRGLESEGGWGEVPIPTFPATSFVQAGPVTALLRHATEYEIVDGGEALALTILRAVGSISVNVHPMRDEPAASEIPIPGAQERGALVEEHLAILPSPAGWQAAGAVRAAEDFRADPLVTRGTAPRGTPLPPARTGIALVGDGVQLSSLRRVEGGIELRAVALSERPVAASMRGAFDHAYELDLLGGTIGRIETQTGRLARTLAPWEIATIRLE